MFHPARLEKEVLLPWSFMEDSLKKWVAFTSAQSGNSPWSGRRCGSLRKLIQSLQEL